MEKLKQWVVLTVAACVAIAAAGWFLLISPKRSEAADLRTQAAEQLRTNNKLENELQVLKAQAKDLPKEQAKLAAVAAKIPDNPALPGLIRSMLEAATESGVELVSLTPGEPQLVQAAAGTPAAPAPAAPAAGQQTPTAPAAGAAAPATPAAPTPGPAGQLATIALSVNVVGDYFEVQQFMAAVEELTRAVRVENFSMIPGVAPTEQEGESSAVEDGRSLSATISGYVYMAANRPAPVAAKVPGAESAAAPAPAADAAAAPTADSAE